jgi:hypothetical protein
MDVTEKILEQIAHHRAEILRLESALAVITEVTGKPARKDAPMITVRRTVPVQEGRNAPTRRKASEFKYTAAEVEAAILADLKANGPSKSADIGKRVAEFTEGLDKRLWQSLYALKKLDKLQRDPVTKAYSLAADSVSKAA